MERNGITSEQAAVSKKHIKATRLWASFRSQTLARTVEGIMYYEAALRLLATMESVKTENVRVVVVVVVVAVVAFFCLGGGGGDWGCLRGGVHF